MATIREVLESSKRCKAQLEELGYTLPKALKYEVSGRMSSSLGICNEHMRTHEFTIKINRDVPLEILDDTMIHEQIHAVLGVRAGHGYRFLELANEVNKAFGYSVGTKASKQEAQIMNAIQMEKGISIPMVKLVCLSCHKEFNIKSTRKAARNHKNFRCRCGGCLDKIG